METFVVRCPSGELSLKLCACWMCMYAVCTWMSHMSPRGGEGACLPHKYRCYLCSILSIWHLSTNLLFRPKGGGGRTHGVVSDGTASCYYRHHWNLKFCPKARRNMMGDQEHACPPCGLHRDKFEKCPPQRGKSSICLSRFQAQKITLQFFRADSSQMFATLDLRTRDPGRVPVRVVVREVLDEDPPEGTVLVQFTQKQEVAKITSGNKTQATENKLFAQGIIKKSVFPGQKTLQSWSFTSSSIRQETNPITAQTQGGCIACQLHTTWHYQNVCHLVVCFCLQKFQQVEPPIVGILIAAFCLQMRWNVLFFCWKRKKNWRQDTTQARIFVFFCISRTTHHRDYLEGRGHREGDPDHLLRKEMPIHPQGSSDNKQAAVWSTSCVISQSAPQFETISAILATRNNQKLCQLYSTCRLLWGFTKMFLEVIFKEIPVVWTTPNKLCISLTVLVDFAVQLTHGKDPKFVKQSLQPKWWVPHCPYTHRNEWGTNQRNCRGWIDSCPCEQRTNHLRGNCFSSRDQNRAVTVGPDEEADHQADKEVDLGVSVEADHPQEPAGTRGVRTNASTARAQSISEKTKRGRKVKTAKMGAADAKVLMDNVPLIPPGEAMGMHLLSLWLDSS